MTITRSLSLGALGVFAAIGCSESDLRQIYEAPEFFEQPDALGPTQWQDDYQQRTVAQSDILFVVDSSCSMEGEQDELASNFDGFISNFVGTTVDYHIGVVNGDLSGMSSSERGRLEERNGVRWISPSTADPVGTFNDMARLGSEGTGACEMGLQATFSALNERSNPGGWNAGFARPDALLSIIIVSDENDSYNNWDPFFGGCDGIGPDEFVPWLQGLRPWTWQDEIIFTGIIGDAPGGCEVGDNQGDYGEAYWTVIDSMGGNFWSICSTDWADFLVELGLEAAGLKRFFFLRRVPDLETLTVYLDDVEADESTWSYDPVKNSIEFPVEFIPQPLTRVRVTYTLIEDQGASVVE
jgi:hypothetical protein